MELTRAPLRRPMGGVMALAGPPGWRWGALTRAGQMGSSLASGVCALLRRQLVSARSLVAPGGRLLPDHSCRASGCTDSGGGLADIVASFMPGDVVIIHGLEGDAQRYLNGRLAEVRGGQPASGLLLVRLDPTDPVDAWKQVPACNLRSASEAAPDCPRESVGALAALSGPLLLQEVLAGLCADSLCSLRACSTQCLHFDSELGSEAWERACASCWSSKSPRYHLTGARKRELEAAFPGASWRQLYHSLASAAREPFDARHLTALSWAFNFTREAGGTGLRTLQIVRFEVPLALEHQPASCGVLRMRGYPPLTCKLHESVLRIANFAPHGIRRLPSWEWKISNSNVIFVSGPALPDPDELSVDEVITNLQLFPDTGLLGIPDDEC